MPFRFRKTLKIIPGIKLNLSKSGLSTSIGKQGASLNLGKRGVRATVGLPGTGISYTAAPSKINLGAKPNNSSAPPAAQGTSRPPALPNKGIKIPRGCLIPVAIIAICGQIYFCSAVISGIVNPTPAPTLDVNAINTQAVQTALASWPTETPTFTPLPANTSLPTSSPLPTETQTPLSTRTPYLTETLPPNCLQEYPSFCILPGQRISCDQLPSNFRVLPPDSLGYDKDGDGVGCED